MDALKLHLRHCWRGAKPWLALLIIIGLYAALVWYDFGKFSYTEYEWWEKFYHQASSVFTGLFVSVLIYLLVVHVPSQRRRKLIKSYLAQSYEETKRDILQCIVWASQKGKIRGGIDGSFMGIDKMMTFEEFRSVFYFDNAREADEGWNAFLSGFTSERHEEMRLNLEKFLRVVSSMRQSSAILDDDMFIHLQGLEEFIFEKLSLEYKYESDMKAFYRFLWTMFTGGSIISGQLDCDPIEELIREI